MSTQWSLKGQYFESCNCDLVCPCIFLMPPTHGFCNALVAWHIEEGNLNNISLNGINVAVYLEAPGLLTDGGWQIRLYIDDSASEEQAGAIGELWSGHHGGHLGVIASLVKEVKSVKQAPIEFTVDGKKRYLKVGSFAENEITAIDGQDGGDVIVDNHPLAIAPGNAAIVHKAKAWVKDEGVNHSHTDTVGLGSAFQYGPA
jgi:hypothetical protein